MTESLTNPYTAKPAETGQQGAKKILFQTDYHLSIVHYTLKLMKMKPIYNGVLPLNKHFMVLVKKIQYNGNNDVPADRNLSKKEFSPISCESFAAGFTVIVLYSFLGEHNIFRLTQNSVIDCFHCMKYPWQFNKC